jgi:hypothetical protein
VRRLQGTAALLALAALLGACGDSYAKSDFVAQANAICASAVREARGIQPPTFAGSETERARALAPYLAKVLPVAQSELDRIRDLKRPPGTDREQALLDRYIRALAQAVSGYRDLLAAARRGDAQGVAAAQAALRANPVAALAARYGLRSCGVPGATGA